MIIRKNTSSSIDADLIWTLRTRPSMIIQRVISSTNGYIKLTQTR